MKTILLFVILLYEATLATGQVTQGNIFISGSGRFNTNNSSTSISGTNPTEYPKVLSTGLGLSAGYFVTERIVVGLNLSISSRKTQFSHNHVLNRISYGGGLFGRFYIPLGEKLYFFGNCGVNYSGGGFKSDLDSGEYKGIQITTVSVGAQPGVVYFPHKRIGVEIKLGNVGWSNRNTVTPNQTIHNEGGFDLGFHLSTLNLGLQFLFKK